MLRHPPLQLLRALAAAGGTRPIPSAAAAVESSWRPGGLGGRVLGSREQEEERQHQQPSPPLPHPSPSSQQRGFASRGPSFMEPQARRAMKQKRQAQQRQRLLRDMKGGSSVVAVGSSGDATAAPRRTAPKEAAAAADATQEAGAASGAADDAAPASSSSSPQPARPPNNNNNNNNDDDDDGAGGNGPGTPLEMQREQSSWLPGWMRTIMPASLGGGLGRGGRRRQQQQQQGQDAAVSPAAAADNNSAAENENANDDDGRYANLEKYRDLSLEAFLQHQAEQSDDTPPPPRPAPNRRTPPLSPLRRTYQQEESRRVLHYRARHHVRLVEALREDERKLVESDPKRALSSQRLLRSVAARTGYSPGQVGDMLHAYESLRFRVNALCDWRAAGRRMPQTQAELTGVVEQARRAREGQDLQVLLAERRTPGERCPLKPGHLSALGGRRAVCPQTRLPYGECCGALTFSADGGGGSQRARASAAR